MLYTVKHFKTLSSTQDKAKEFAKKQAHLKSEFVVIVADNQTKGRGRFRRKWHSSPKGLWFSMLFCPKSADKMQYLTLIASIAAAKTVKKIAGIEVKIKWPNDLHYNGKKICGILTETILGKENSVIIGIGINLNQKSFPNAIKQTSTSLKQLTKKIYKKEAFLNAIILEFISIYDNYYSKGKFKEIIQEWKLYSDTIGRDVRIVHGNKEMKGRAIGIDSECRLMVKNKRGRISRIIEGDIFVRYR